MLLESLEIMGYAGGRPEEMDVVIVVGSEETAEKVKELKVLQEDYAVFSIFVMVCSASFIIIVDSFH